MAAFADYRLLQHADVRLDRLRVDAGEKRVQLLANGDKLNPVLAEDVRQHPAPGSVHGIDSELEACFADEVEVGKAANRLDVGGLQINFLNCRAIALRHGPSSS